MFQAYPGGPLGIAILLLRGSAALTLLSRAGGAPEGNPVPAILCCGLAALFLLGIGTRTASALAAAGILITLRRAELTGLADDFAAVLAMAAIFLIGPGAFSADALRFGRTTLRAGGGPRTKV